MVLFVRLHVSHILSTNEDYEGLMNLLLSFSSCAFKGVGGRINEHPLTIGNSQQFLSEYANQFLAQFKSMVHLLKKHQ